MDLLTTHLLLSITSNKLEVSAEPSKSADTELRLLEGMNSSKRSRRWLLSTSKHYIIEPH
jgi:hypothetical protein